MNSSLSHAAAAIQDRFRFGVSGMTCASCVGRVERSLREVPGVADVAVNLATETVEVHAARPLPLQALDAAVRDAGYQMATARSNWRCRA